MAFDESPIGEVLIKANLGECRDFFVIRGSFRSCGPHIIQTSRTRAQCLIMLRAYGGSYHGSWGLHQGGRGLYPK